MRHEDGRYTVVPVHAGKLIGPGLLLKIWQAEKTDWAVVREGISRQRGRSEKSGGIPLARLANSA